MATRTERRSEICAECGAVVTVEYTALVQDDTIHLLDIDITCPNEQCATQGRVAEPPRSEKRSKRADQGDEWSG